MTALVILLVLSQIAQACWIARVSAQRGAARPDPLPEPVPIPVVPVPCARHGRAKLRAFREARRARRSA